MHCYLCFASHVLVPDDGDLNGPKRVVLMMYLLRICPVVNNTNAKIITSQHNETNSIETEHLTLWYCYFI